MKSVVAAWGEFWKTRSLTHLPNLRRSVARADGWAWTSCGVFGVFVGDPDQSMLGGCVAFTWLDRLAGRSENWVARDVNRRSRSAVQSAKTVTHSKFGPADSPGGDCRVGNKSHGWFSAASASSLAEKPARMGFGTDGTMVPRVDRFGPEKQTTESVASCQRRSAHSPVRLAAQDVGLFRPKTEVRILYGVLNVLVTQLFLNALNCA